MNPSNHKRGSLFCMFDPLFLIMCLFTATFFIYRDFEIRMIFGYAILCAILGVHVLRRAALDRPPVQDPLRVSFMVLSAAVLVNFFRPDSRHDADSFSFIISMLICCAAIALADADEKEAKRAMAVCFGGAVFITLFVQFFQANPWYFWNWFMMKLSETAASYLCYYVPRGYAITLNGCTYTNYILFIGIAVCCGYLASGRKHDWKSAVAAAFAVLFFCTILIVGRRGELLGAAICLVLLALALCGQKTRRVLLIGGVIAAVVGFAAIVALLPWLKTFPSLHRYVMTVEKLLRGQDITSGRLDLYAIAWNAFVQNPLFGIGFDQFHTLIPASFLAVHGQDVEDVHCIYLQFLTETGIVGAPFLMAPLFYCYYLVCAQFVRLKKRPGELQTARMLCISSFLLQSFLLILGIYDPNFQRVIFWCFYALAILMLQTALKLEGAAFTDPVSRLLQKLIDKCVPLCSKVWGWAAGLFSRLRLK